MEPVQRELTLKLFGGFEARCSGETIFDLRKRDGERLLALLALRAGQAVKSETVAETLWPASGSLDSLHQSVSHLRRSLGENAWRLQSPRGAVMLNLAGANVDVANFDAAIAAGDAHSLKAAISLYRRGALLEGWDEVKDRWILAERDKRKRKYAEALRKVASECTALQKYADAAGYLRSYVNLNPADEQAWCDLMRAVVASGERVAAINLFEKCRSLFQSKYKLDPPAQMVELLRDIHPATKSQAPESPQESSNLNVPRGVVLLDSPYYVLRSTDQVFADAIARRESVVLVKGPRQTGKTSLLARGLQEARHSGAQVVLTDLQSISEEHWASTDSFCLSLAQDLCDQLDLPEAPDTTWNPARGPNRNLQRYLCDHALQHSAAPLVWGLDEVDKLFAYPFSTAIFALFRSWHNARALQPHDSWDRLTLAIAYATEVHLLIQDLNQSPFNVGLQLSLQDFTLEQTDDLNRRYDSPLASEHDVKGFHQLLGGSPYLVHRGIYEMVTGPLTFTAFEAQSASESGCFGDHLQRIEHAIRSDAALRGVVMGLLDDRPVIDSKSFYRLKSAGLLIGDDPQEAAWRSSIYRSYLNNRLP